MPSEFAKRLAETIAAHVAGEVERWVQNATSERPVCNKPGCGTPMYQWGRAPLGGDMGEGPVEILLGIYMCPQCGSKRLIGEPMPTVKG